MPVVINGCLVAFFGEAGSPEETVPRCLRALALDVEKPSAPLSLHVDLTQLKGLSGMRAKPTLMKLFGLESLRSFHAAVRPNGRHAQLELEVEFGDGNRGMMAGILPAESTLPSLLARVPAEATPWLTVPFRLGVMFRVGLEMAAAADDDEGGVEAVRQRLHDQLGLHLDNELFDHVGGEEDTGRFDVGGAALDEVSGLGFLVEVSIGEALDVVVELVLHPFAYPVGGLGRC